MPRWPSSRQASTRRRGAGSGAACRSARSTPARATAASWRSTRSTTPFYDLERFGFRFVASPRHADVLLVTGPVTANMREALERTYAATPGPKWVVAVGDCARDGGFFAGSYAVRRAASRRRAGRPPHPPAARRRRSPCSRACSRCCSRLSGADRAQVIRAANAQNLGESGRAALARRRLRSNNPLIRRGFARRGTPPMALARRLR